MDPGAGFISLTCNKLFLFYTMLLKPFELLLQTRRPDLRRNYAYYCEEDFSDANRQSALMRRNKAFPAGPEGKPKIDFEPIA